MKRFYLTLLSMLTILASFQQGGWYRPARAQNSGPFAAGDLVLTAAARLPVYVQPDFSSGVAAELLYGMKSRVIGIKVGADGTPWYYLTEYAYGWVPGSTGGLPTLIPYSEEALDKMAAQATAIIKANPGDVEAYVRRGTIFMVRHAFDDSIADYNKAISLRSEDAALHDYLGKAYLDADEYELALLEFQKAINLGRALPNTYNRLAIALENTGQDDLAIQYYQQAIDLEPGYGLVYCNLGKRLYYYRHDKIGASELLDRALEIDPYLATAYVYRGAMLTEAGGASAYEQAIENYNQALAIDPGSAVAYAYRGLVNIFTGDWMQSEEDLLQAAALDPYFEDPLWHLAFLYGSMYRYQEAVEYYTRVIALAQSSYQDYGLLYRAQNYLMLGQYDLALADIDSFIVYAQTQDVGADFTLVAFMVRAAIYLHLAHDDPAKYRQAASDYREAFEIDSGQAAGFYQWCDAYGVMCEITSAIEALQAQVGADSRDTRAWWHLGVALMQVGRFDEALAAFEQFKLGAGTVPLEFEEFTATIAGLAGGS